MWLCTSATVQFSPFVALVVELVLGALTCANAIIEMDLSYSPFNPCEHVGLWGP